MPPMSAEGTVSRTYIDWLVSVPWKQKSKEIKDLTKAEEVLDEEDKLAGGIPDTYSVTARFAAAGCRESAAPGSSAVATTPTPTVAAAQAIAAEFCRFHRVDELTA